MDAVEQQYLVCGINEGVDGLAHHCSAAGPDSGNRFAGCNQQIADKGGEHGRRGGRLRPSPVMLVSNGAPEVHCAGAPSAMRKNALAEAAAAASAQAIATAWNPLTSAGPAAPRTPPSSAVPTMPPVRATALFRPEAEPVCRLSTDPRIAAVRGATAPAMPTAITRIAGEAVVQ